jgi:hypothetical protein
MTPSPNDVEAVMDRKHVCTDGVISAYRDAAEVLQDIIKRLPIPHGKQRFKNGSRSSLVDVLG